MTLTFVPSQEFEVKKLLYDLVNDNGKDTNDFYDHVRRFAFSIIMTSTYGHRSDSWDNEYVRFVSRSSQVLNKISRAGTFIEDEIPLLAKLPPWLQPSRSRALRYAVPVLEAKMRLWNWFEREVDTNRAPPCFAKDLMQSDYKAQGLCVEDAAWIAGGQFPPKLSYLRLFMAL
jgi:hypothetical protein